MDVEVTVERAGQLVTVGAHEVMVFTSVMVTVDSCAYTEMAEARKVAARTAKRILIVGFVCWGEERVVKVEVVLMSGDERAGS